MDNNQGTFAEELNTMFASFKNMILKSKGCEMKVTNVYSNIIKDGDDYEVNIIFHYRFNAIPQKNATKKSIEDDLFDRFVNDIIKSTIQKWKKQNKIRTKVV